MSNTYVHIELSKYNRLKLNSKKLKGIFTDPSSPKCLQKQLINMTYGDVTELAFDISDTLNSWDAIE